MEEHPSRDGCALVTGGGIRLGAAIVRRLAADGWSVAIHTRKECAKAVVVGVSAKRRNARSLGEPGLADAAASASRFGAAQPGLAPSSFTNRAGSFCQYRQPARQAWMLIFPYFGTPVLLVFSFTDF